MVGALNIAAALGNALDDYVNKEEDVYAWFDKGETSTSAWGGTAHVLNVNSQTWMYETKVSGPRGNIWDHIVVVVVPKHLKYTNISTLWVTGDCNPGPHPFPHTDEDLSPKAFFTQFLREAQKLGKKGCSSAEKLLIARSLLGTWWPLADPKINVAQAP